MKKKISILSTACGEKENKEITSKNIKEQMCKLPKFKNIEFLRFLFVSVLVYFHLVQLLASLGIKAYLPLQILSRDAHVLVEFFFILSGFFLYFDIQKYQDISFYFIKRFLRLWFVLAFVVALSIISAPFIKYTIVDYVNSLLNILLLNNIGLTNSISNYIHVWYISVLFWISLFYFSLFKLFDKKRVMFSLVIMVYLAYVILFQAFKGNFGSPAIAIYGLLTAGMLRGIAGLGIGLIMGMIYEKYIPNTVRDDEKTNTFHRIIFSIAEIVILFVLANLLVFNVWKINNDFIFVPLFAALIMLFLVKKGIVSKLLENKVSDFLGKFSYSIFVMQGYLIILFYTIFNANFTQVIVGQRILTLSIGCLFAILGGILVYYLIERPSSMWCKNKFLNNGAQK